jgi:8-hydroxy-5-deazaflavin:NADPH oxidoreductase
LAVTKALAAREATMKIGVLGSGMVGQNLGGVLAHRGHDVVLGTRSPDDLDREHRAGKTLRAWLLDAGDRGRVGTFAEAAAHGAVVLNATNGAGTLDALHLAGAANLNGKILIDVSNPLDFSRGMPPTLFICNDDSLGERVQAAFPDVRVVKTLNTTNTFIMGDPRQLADGDHTMFVCGNDAAARQQVVSHLQEWFGWNDIIDLGDITSARGMEMVLPIWVRLMTALGTPMFNFRIVR